MKRVNAQYDMAITLSHRFVISSLSQLCPLHYIAVDNSAPFCLDRSCAGKDVPDRPVTQGGSDAGRA